MHPPSAASGGDDPGFSAPGGVSSRPRRTGVGTWKDGGTALDRQYADTTGVEWSPAVFSASREWAQVPAAIGNLGHSAPSRYQAPQRVRKGYLVSLPILQNLWHNDDDHDLRGFIARDYWEPCLVDTCDPRVLQAKASKYNEDNPSWEMAMNGPFAEDYWEAYEVELNTLKNDIKSWTLVKRTSDMNVLPSTWAFKLKRFPDGTAKKFKARFCVRGDRQKEGIDTLMTC